MNPTNAKVFSIFGIILNVILMILSGIYVVKFIADLQHLILTIQGFDPNDPAVIEAIMNNFLRPILIFTIVFSIVGILLLLFNILAVIEAAKLEENRMPFILLIVGFLISTVGLVGFVLLLIEANKLEKQQQNPPEVNNFY